MRPTKNLNTTLFRRTALNSALLSVFAATSAGVVSAQQQEVEEMVVTGSRQVVRDQISVKRTATQIVDGLTASDIGDLAPFSAQHKLTAVTLQTVVVTAPSTSASSHPS